MFKTHVAMTLFAVLFLFEHVEYTFVFVVVSLVSGILPDIDSGFSTLGKRKIFRPVQTLTRHRGFFHSLTFCIGISVLLAFYFPIYSLPFFLGYGLHLFADSFTVDGIRPFWPLKIESKGKLRAGSAFEGALFIGFCIIDAILLFVFAASLFA